MAWGYTKFPAEQAMSVDKGNSKGRCGVSVKLLTLMAEPLLYTEKN